MLDKFYTHWCTISVERILNAKTVAAASPMAPACGLYLGEVKYDLPSS
jgi:tRNA pseudouridine38-40 synthase